MLSGGLKCTDILVPLNLKKKKKNFKRLEHYMIYVIEYVGRYATRRYHSKY